MQQNSKAICIDKALIEMIYLDFQPLQILVETQDLKITLIN